MDLQRQLRQRVPVDVRMTSGVSWSPDGKRLAIGQWSDEILLVDPATGKAQPLAHVGSVASWSPNGYLLSSPRPGAPAHLVPVEGSSRPIEIGPPDFMRGGGAGDFSPDGRHVALTVLENGRPEVYVQPMPPATAFTRVSINGGSHARWGKDSSELFFLSPEGAIMVASIQPGPAVTASVPRELFRLDGSLHAFDVSADGQRFLVSSCQRNAGDVAITVAVNWWTELTGR